MEQAKSQWLMLGLVTIVENEKHCDTTVAWQEFTAQLRQIFQISIEYNFQGRSQKFAKGGGQNSPPFPSLPLPFPPLPSPPLRSRPP